MASYVLELIHNIISFLWWFNRWKKIKTNKQISECWAF